MWIVLFITPAYCSINQENSDLFQSFLCGLFSWIRLIREKAFEWDSILAYWPCIYFHRMKFSLTIPIKLQLITIMELFHNSSSVLKISSNVICHYKIEEICGNVTMKPNVLELKIQLGDLWFWLQVVRLLSSSEILVYCIYVFSFQNFC